MTPKWTPLGTNINHDFGALPFAGNTWEGISKDTRKTTNRGHSRNHQQAHSGDHQQGTLGEPPAGTLGKPLAGDTRGTTSRDTRTTPGHTQESKNEKTTKEHTSTCLLPRRAPAFAKRLGSGARRERSEGAERCFESGPDLSEA